MRRLSDPFMDALKDPDFLAPLIDAVKYDDDLDLQIRNDYLNIYYKGNSLLNLSRWHGIYKVGIDAKFKAGLDVPLALERGNVSHFLSLIPKLKVNIARISSSSREIEYAQLIVRANNRESRTNSEYFILDREYSLKDYRFDLIGFFWRWHGRKRYQEVPLCLMEVKYALNNDIQKLHSQLQGYYELIKNSGPALSEEYQVILQQKLALGTFNLPQERIEAMKTLKISPDINKFQFIIILVDYNPYSKLHALESLQELPFADRIRIFHSGFAMWVGNAVALPPINPGAPFGVT